MKLVFHIQVFSNGFGSSLFRNSSSECGYPDFCGDYSLHPIRANGDILVGFCLVVLLAHKNPSTSSTHFPLVECRRFFKAVRRVLLDDSAWPLLCGYRRVELKFLIFGSSQRFLFTLLSNCGPLLVTIDCDIPNRQTIFFHTN